MKNEDINIRQLLEKFYEAETSEQEEEILKEYFRSDVDPEFEIYKPQFAFYDQGYSDTRGISSGFDEKFFANVQAADPKLKKSKQVHYMWYAGIAATFVVAFGLFFLDRTNDSVSEVEYDQAVNAFILISEKMDIASGDLHKLEVFEDRLDSFGAFEALENYGKHLINNENIYE